MNCMRCGRKIEDTQAFCPECLEKMKKYPVKPGTAVYIPVRSESAAQKPARTAKEKTPEEQINALGGWIRVLVACVLGLTTALALSLGALAFALVEDLPQETEPLNPMRRNYTTAPRDVE